MEIVIFDLHRAGNGAVKGPLHNYYIEYQVYSIYVIE